MARGRHLSLEEARKSGKLKQFAKEHPATGDAERFDRLMKTMVKGKPVSRAGKKPSKAGT